MYLHRSVHCEAVHEADLVRRVQDLLAAGIAGLQKAINRFDPTRGFKFSTYSHWWIRQTIQRTVIQHGRVIR